MHPSRLALLIACFSLLCACGAASSSGDDGAGSGDSPMAAALTQAWSHAKSGKNPSNDCARVKGYALRAADSASAAALAQCNFDIPVHYFNALLDAVDAGQRECRSFITALATQLPAMTLSLRGLAKASAKAGQDQADTVAKTLGTALGHNDSTQARQRIKDSLRERAIASCPIAEGLL